MTPLKFAALSLTVSVTALLHACGGGGGINDGQTPLRVEPQVVTLQSGTANCLPADGPTVFVFGGVPPYTVRNTVPNQVSVSATSINKGGEGTKVRFLGGCLQSLPLVVVDDVGTTTTIGLNYLPATQ